VPQEWHTCKELGFQAPEETTIDVDIGYASTKFRIPKDYHEPDRVLLFVGPPLIFLMGQSWRSSRIIRGT
jgi:hypothetical protein